MPSFPEPDSARHKVLSSPAHLRKQEKKKNLPSGVSLYLGLEGKAKFKAKEEQLQSLQKKRRKWAEKGRVIL